MAGTFVVVLIVHVFVDEKLRGMFFDLPSIIISTVRDSGTQAASKYLQHTCRLPDVQGKVAGRRVYILLILAFPLTQIFLGHIRFYINIKINKYN